MGLYTPWFIGLVWLWTAQAAFALSYPVPQPKPCKVYWDGPKIHKFIADHPDTVRYVATSHWIVVQHKDKVMRVNGKAFHIKLASYHSYDEKGCYVFQQYTGRDAEQMISKLTDQEDV